MKIYTDAIQCENDASVQEVAKLIKEHKVRHVYVVDDGKLVGLVSGLSIIEDLVAEGRDYKDLKAKDILHEVQSVTEDQDIEYAYGVMRTFNTFICPVVDKDGKLKGYYKFVDVCEEINKKLENESN